MISNANMKTDSRVFLIKNNRKSMVIKEDMRKTCTTEICADDDKVMKASSVAKRSDIYDFFLHIKN